MRVGIDLVSIKRIEALLERPAELRALFSERELSEMNTAERLSGVFALKEAYVKALGAPREWQEIEVAHTPAGAPYLTVAGEVIDTVSLSHEGEYATAIVLLL